MEVSNCKPCRAALKKALLNNQDPSKLKMKDGHLEGCPSLAPPPEPKKEAPSDVYPWSEQAYKIVPTQRPQPAESGQHGGGFSRDGTQGSHPAGGPDRGTGSVRPPARRPAARSDRPPQHRGRARVHGNGYAEAAAQNRQQPERIQQFKVVQHANEGERKDQIKGVWFVVLVLVGVVGGAFFPPILLVCLGAILMLFLRR